MMSMIVLLAAVNVAFPAADAKLPPVKRTYVIGAVEPGWRLFRLGMTNEEIAVHENGGWVTMLDCRVGTNSLELLATNPLRPSLTNCQTRTFVVSAPAKKTATAQPPPPPRVYEKLPYAGDTPKAPPTGKRPEEIVVVLDPGHGGKDPGAISPHHLEEKDANLRMAKAVRKALRKRGYRVVMTREDDREVALYDRPKVAFAENADAFISIHHNATACDVDPRNYRYHATYAWNEIGMKLATAINGAMANALGEDLPDKGVIRANYAVTRNPEIPSCLIEVDFITTPEGEADSWSPQRRQFLAEAIAEGFAKWTRE